MISKVEIYQDSSHEWRWRLRASNGRIVATSGEGFKRHSSCHRSMLGVWDTFAAEDFEIVDEKHTKTDG